MKISVIMPVHNGMGYLRRSLDALVSSAYRAHEIIVVDDASSDGSADEALRRGLTVVRLKKNAGPAGARNAGAGIATGDILFFVDSDVVVRKETLSRVAEFFTAHAARSKVAAIFGSYDDEPEHPGFVSQYRNLLHHYHHQQAMPDAFSFWAGCGAVRKEVFGAIGGFDETRYKAPSIEDIELGWRIKKLGLRIMLDRGLLVKHLKGWNLSSMVRTDITRRAVPWSRLIMETGSMPRDLNLKRAEKASALIVLFSLVAIAFLTLSVVGANIGMWRPACALAGLLMVFFYLNRPLYTFFARKKGIIFAIKVVPLHMLYYLYSSSAFSYCWLDRKIRGRSQVKVAAEKSGA